MAGKVLGEIAGDWLAYELGLESGMAAGTGGGLIGGAMNYFHGQSSGGYSSSGGVTDDSVASGGSSRQTTTSSSSSDRNINNGGEITTVRQTVTDGPAEKVSKRSPARVADEAEAQRILDSMWPNGVAGNPNVTEDTGRDQAEENKHPEAIVPPDQKDDRSIGGLDDLVWNPDTGRYDEVGGGDEPLVDVELDDDVKDEKTQDDLTFDQAAEESANQTNGSRNVSRRLTGWGTALGGLLLIGGGVGAEGAKRRGRKKIPVDDGVKDGTGGGGGDGTGGGGGGGTGGGGAFGNLADNVNKVIDRQYDQYAMADRIDTQQERLLSLRPFLAIAGTDLFDVQQDEESDKLKMSNLTMGMTPYNPLGILDNKLALSQMVTDGLRYSGDLFVMPTLYSGGTLTNGATLYGTIRKAPSSIDPTEFRPPPSNNKRMRLR